MPKHAVNFITAYCRIVIVYSWPIIATNYLTLVFGEICDIS